MRGVLREHRSERGMLARVVLHLVKQKTNEHNPVCVDMLLFECVALIWSRFMGVRLNSIRRWLCLAMHGMDNDPPRCRRTG